MKKITFISCMLAGCLALSPALAQDKVVVVPLGKSTRVAGTDKQVQYNDNGTQAGANVYYNKTTGNVGIGEAADTSAGDDLSIVDMDGHAVLYIGSPLNSVINMESLAGTAIEMFSANNNYDTQYPMIIGKKSRGTYDAFEPVQSGDRLLGIFAKGQRTTGTSTNFDDALQPSAGILFIASEDWTSAPADTQGGTRITFFTTENVTGTKDARMRIENNGNVGIGTGSATPTSTLQVNGYVQLALTSGVPPAADCDATEERGRMIVDNAAGNLYICMDSGWVAK